MGPEDNSIPHSSQLSPPKRSTDSDLMQLREEVIDWAKTLFYAQKVDTLVRKEFHLHNIGLLSIT